MHHIYHTEGVILGSKNFGENGKYFYILTRELGLVYAHAQGVRKLSSKLRFILQDYNHISVNLVKGKNVWRITTASKTDKLEEIKKDKSKLQIFYNVSCLLRRLLQGEESNVELFDSFLSGLVAIESAEKKDLRNIEIVLVLRLLNLLGYIGSMEDKESLVASPFDSDIILSADKNRSKIIRAINEALRETQL